MNVLTNVASAASHAACNLTGCTNLLVGNFSSFIELSSYRPFGTYVFCIENRKIVVVTNSDAVLQLLYHFSLLSSEEEGEVFCQKLKESMAHENVLQLCLEMQNVVYLESAFDEAIGTNMALDDPGLSTRARLSLITAMELEKLKVQNEEKIDEESIKEDLKKIKEY